MQSDSPRDPSLIPTVLTIEPPAGVRVTHLVFPMPTDFKQAGQAQPLAVFEHDFVAGAELAIDASVAGRPRDPGRLRYQACDDKVCFARPRHPSSGRFALSRPEPQPGRRTPPCSRGSPRAAYQRAGGAGAAAARRRAAGRGRRQRPREARRFAVRGTTGGYLDRETSSSSSATPNRASCRRACSTGAVRSRSCCSS